VNAKAWRVAAVRLVRYFEVESDEGVATGEQRARVDAILRALGVAEVRVPQHCRVESGRGARSGERRVHLERNESGWHPFGTPEGTEIRKRTK
jgi:hypothetical protein